MKRKLDISKTAVTVILLNIFQVLSITGVLGYMMFFQTSFSAEKNRFWLIVIVLLFFTAFMNSYLSVKDAFNLIHTDFQNQIFKDSLGQQEDLNKTLRAQRHDFMNHLQVVYSLMEMEEYKDARDYIDKVYKDIQKVSRVLKTASPAVNALLRAKILACENRGIRTVLSVSSSLSQLKIPDWELCRVLGNLIDNAIYAVKDRTAEKQIGIFVNESLKSHSFRVENNGPAIPPSQLEKIFDAGFTTKGDRGDGMGLAIAQELVSPYGGRITVSSGNSLTAFIVEIPKG